MLYITKVIMEILFLRVIKLNLNSIGFPVIELKLLVSLPETAETTFDLLMVY